jgi:transcriptional regulator with XRE-family HTH domain
MATGRDLQEIRKAAGLNGDVVAAALGTHRAALSNMEQGREALPRAEVVRYVNAIQKCRAEAGKRMKELMKEAKAKPVASPADATHRAADTDTGPEAQRSLPAAVAATRGGLAAQAPTASPLEVA